MFSLICRLKTQNNAVILLDMGHTLGENTHGRNREREGTYNLNVVDVLPIEERIKVS
jgi:hypothetical protein